ncbi:hypothetical protein [Blastopirellula retiformator]|uniref:Uncharacterized protein n=1 Tax=Blastopirellula retiformator TaxID=2527970 RepID=A0A5C5UVM9_9BACT|nr:hypothetical protein [Blastopirellula retiformator]TWT29462.1 hypothetical protein Enr8_49780 [Blastopirellula retiformator]
METEFQNPYASPHATAKPIQASGIPPLDWCQFPTISGLMLGAFQGAVLAVLHVIWLSILLPSDPGVLFSLPLRLVVFGLAFGVMGALCGAIVGSVALATRNAAWRTAAHFFSCAIVPPAVFAGPLSAYYYSAHSLAYPGIGFAIMVLFGCGLMMGLYLLGGLKTLDRTEREEASMAASGGDVDERQ